MQDAWLQGQVGKEADAAAFLAKLFRSRGKGVNTPFSPMPKVVVLIEESAAETRRKWTRGRARCGHDMRSLRRDELGNELIACTALWAWLRKMPWERTHFEAAAERAADGLALGVREHPRGAHEAHVRLARLGHPRWL